MKNTIFDVVDYILKKQGETVVIKLHLLLYYCQAWSLVWDDEPLFEDRIESWSFGPVVPRVYKLYEGNFKVSECPIGNKNNLNQEQIDTIDAILKFYGNRSTQWLIHLVREESPYKESWYENSRYSIKEKDKISLESIKNYYLTLDSQDNPG